MRAVLALLSLAVAVTALRRSLVGDSESVEWAALAVLAGLLATASGLLGSGARRQKAVVAPHRGVSRPGSPPPNRVSGERSALRPLAVGSGIAGGLIAAVLLAQAGLLVARAFLTGGPDRSIAAGPDSR